MKTLRKALSFFHFDGDGEGGAEASTPANEQGKTEVKPNEVQYGKAPEGEAKSSQVGSDTGSEAKDLNAEFAELIGKGGKYHDIYGQKVSDAIQDRFRNQADLQAQVDDITDGLSPLFLRYGLKTGDYEGLTQAIASDDSFYQTAAEQAGLDVEQYKRNLQLQREAERGRQITEAYEAEQRRMQVYAQWEAETESLKQTFPNFDLGLEIEKNDRFSQLLDAGVSVTDAFYATHVHDIYKGIGAEAETRVTQNVVSTIQQKASRPIEGGAHHAAAVVRRSDPSTLSDADLDEINRRVERGESVSF